MYKCVCLYYAYTLCTHKDTQTCAFVLCTLSSLSSWCSPALIIIYHHPLSRILLIITSMLQQYETNTWPQSDPQVGHINHELNQLWPYSKKKRQTQKVLIHANGMYYSVLYIYTEVSRNRGTPSSHPFIDGCSMIHKPTSYWESPHLWKPPISSGKLT